MAGWLSNGLIPVILCSSGEFHERANAEFESIKASEIVGISFVGESCFCRQVFIEFTTITHIPDNVLKK